MKKALSTTPELLKSKKSMMKLGLTTLVAIGAFTGAASAALTLHVDTAAKTMYATGSDSGITGGTSWGANTVSWKLLGTENTYTYTDLIGLFTVTGGAALDGIQANLFTGSSPNMVLAVNTDALSNTTVTVTGAATSISYAGESSFETTIQGLIGSSIAYAPDFGGSGFSAMSVDSVPEPSTTVLVGLGSLATLLRRRR